MKTTLYMVRHCESEGNACRRSHAQFDGIITRKGQRQAEALAKRFQDVPITAIYSSDAYRSRMTAQPLAEATGLPVQLRMLLREYTIGTWEGFSVGHTGRLFPEIDARWQATPYDHTIPGADQFVTVAERGCEIIRRIAAENPGGTVVAVTHSCALTCTLTKLLGQPISYYGSIKSGDNTAVTKLEVDEAGNVEVIYINDDSHLPPDLLRQDYPGRSAATNFDFEYISFPADEARFRAMADEAAGYAGHADTAPLQALVDTSLGQHGHYAFFPMLLDRVCGLVTVIRDGGLGAEYGRLTSMYIADDLRRRGYCEQAFGEAIDVLRRSGCRYLVIPRSEDIHYRRLADRFLFAPLPGHDDLLCMRITVPGAEGPIY